MCHFCSAVQTAITVVEEKQHEKKQKPREKETQACGSDSVQVVKQILARRKNTLTWSSLISPLVRLGLLFAHLFGLCVCPPCSPCAARLHGVERSSLGLSASAASTSKTGAIPLPTLSPPRSALLKPLVALKLLIW